MKEFRGTKGNWEPIYIGEVCIGVGCKGEVTEVICNSILPDTDEEYDKIESQLSADMKLISAAPELLEALQELVRYAEPLTPNTELGKLIEKSKQAIYKALNHV